MRRQKAQAERRFRVLWDAKREGYVATNENGDLLAVDRVLANAITIAVHEAKLASQAGFRSRVFVENQDGIFKREYIGEPLTDVGACSKDTAPTRTNRV